MKTNDRQQSRRDFLKKAGYSVPAILTIKAAPSFAKGGSVIRQKGNNGIGQEKRGSIDGPPPGLAKKGPNLDFNDNGKFAPYGQSGAKAGGRPSK